MKHVALAILMFMVPSLAWSDVTIPYVFTAGQSIPAAQFNANFSAVASEINNHEDAANPHNTTLAQILTTANSCGSNNINFNNNQATNMEVENLSADPAAGHPGRMFVNTTTHLLKFDDGSTIQTVGGTGVNNLDSVLNSGNSAGAHDINVNGNQLLTARMENRTSAPSPSAGRFYYRTDTTTPYVCSGASCTAIGGAQSLSSVLTVGNSAGSTDIDFNGQKAKNVLVDPLASDPGSPTEGRFWYNTTSHIPKFYNGTSSLQIGNTNTLAQTLSLGASTGGASIDFAGGQAQHMVVWNNAGSPGTGTGGYLWYDTGNSSLNYETSGANHRVCSLDGTETLTNHTIDGGSNTLTNIADASLSANVQLLSGLQTVTGKKTFSAPPVIAYIKTPAGGASGHQIPDGIADDTFALLNATQTLTAKTLAGFSVTGNADFGNFQANNFRVENRASDPASGHPGRLFFKTSTGELMVDNGSSIHSLSVNGGTVSGSQFAITGVADSVELTVQGYSTQTSNILEVLNNSASKLFTVDNSGNGRFAGNVTTNSLGSGSTNPATAGALRLATGDTIDWRNFLNNADIALGKDASDQLSWSGTSFLSSSARLLAAGFPALAGDVTSAGGSLTTTVSKIAGTTVSGTTGTTNAVFSNSPTLVSPALGTPTALVGTNITGTASGLTAGNVTTNANLTGVITSVGNATSIASQTGTGTKFVVDTNPTLIGPALGTPTALVGTNITGTAAGLTAGNVTTNANLTGPVTSVGNATTIAANAVANSQLATMAANTVKANVTGGAAVPTDVSLVSAGTASTVPIRDTNANIQGNAFTRNYTTTATSAGTKTLAVGDSRIQYLTGSTTHNVVLPAANTLSQTGDQFEIHNNSTGIVTVKDNGSNTLYAIPGCPSAPCPATIFTVTSIGSANGTWDTATGGGVTQLTTKGDVLVYSTSPTRQAVPGDYGRLVADAAQSTGWRSASYLMNDGKPTKNYVQYADLENNATTGFTAVGCATVTSGYPNCPGSGGAAFTSSNGGRAKNANTSSPAIDSGSNVSGTYSLNLATTGAGAIGDGYVSSLYTLDPSDRGATFTYRIAYKQASGAPVTQGTATDTYAVSFYDAANNTFLTPSNPFCFTITTKGFCTGTVNTNTTTTGLQAFVYSPIAPVGASSLLLDDFYLGTSILPTGPPITNSIAFTPTGSWVNAQTTYTGSWWRNGDKLSMWVKVALAAAPTSATLTVNLPSGLTIDTAKLPGTPTSHMFPGGLFGLGAGNGFVGGVLYNSTTSLAPGYTKDGTTASVMNIGGITQAAPYTFANADYVYFQVSDIPIVGWDSNVTMLSSTSNSNTVQAFTSGTAATYTTPAGVKWIEVYMWGGGGGAGCSGSAACAVAAGAGSSSTFGTSLLTAPGGSAGGRGAAGGVGGLAPTINAPATDIDSAPGGDGVAAATNAAVTTAGLAGGSGGPAGNGRGSSTGNGGGSTGAGASAPANSGGGGGGASINDISGGQAGSGGGGGAYVHAQILNPSATYTYTVALSDSTHGQGATLGTSGAAGGAGASGKIIVVEHYTPNPNVAVDSPYVSMGTEGAGTTTLTNASQRNIITTLSAARTYTLPSGGIKAGDQFTITNTADFALTLQSSGANTIATLNIGTISVIANVNTPTAKADWTVDRIRSKTTLSTTWQFSGGSGGTTPTGATNAVIERNGNFVSLYTPGSNATSGTSNTQFISNSNIPTGYTPAAQAVLPYNNVRNNGGADTKAGVMIVLSTGQMKVSRDLALTAFTNTVSCGFQDDLHGIYYAPL